MTALRGAGYAVLVPFGENTRYDLVIDDGKGLGRVQCKTGRLRKGAVIFRACSSYAHHPNPKIIRRDYLGEIDYFAVYCPETAGVYLVPLQDAALRTQGSLRVASPRNGQRRRIRSAADYQIAEISIRATARPGATSGA
jgi:PD-(D/E)XK nuclease superfamily protein